ncbi:MAG: TIM-barrel domain-containing protein [Terricaulis silvestris]
MAWLRMAAILCVALAASATAWAQDLVQPIPGGVSVANGAGTMQVIALRDDIIRVRISRLGALPHDESWAVLPEARAHHANMTPQGDGFRTAALNVRFEGGRLAVRDLHGRMISADARQGIDYNGAAFALHKEMPASARYFGLGDKAGPLDRRGQAFTLWNTDAYGFGESTDPLYKSIPFTIEIDGDGVSHGLLLDNTWRSWFDFGRLTPDTLSFGAADGVIDYYIVYGPTPRAVLEGYAYLTGPAPLPPRWSLGLQQSRYSYMTPDEVRGIAARFRSEHVPADALYLDIDYQDRYRPFTVNPATFPNLAGLVSDLRRENMRLVLITDLHIAHVPNENYAPYDTGIAGNHFVHAADGQVYVGPVWPGPAVFPDFTRAATRRWWGELYRGFAADGVAGFWNDMDEPAVFQTPTKTMPLDNLHRIDEPGFDTRTATHAEMHNIVGMQNSRATYDGLVALRPNERPFVLTRASYAGGQRYAMTWTGDNSATWNHLRLSVPMLLNLGMSGFAYAGADVGGFIGSPSPELLTRWIEIGSFSPMFRIHSVKESAPHEVWANGPEQTAIRRRYIEERYRLLPYIYALADENARTGVPIMRPVVFEFPTAPSADTSFMLGDDLLVAPPSDWESPATFDVVLPSRGWFDYWTGRRTGQERPNTDIAIVNETPRLDRLPIFVRPGAIIPRQPLVQSTSETPSGPLELHVYPGADCHGALYWDDGHSFAFRHGGYLRQRITCRIEGDAIVVNFAAREGRFTPWWRQIDVVVHGWDRASASASLGPRAIAARVDADAQTAHVLVSDTLRATELRLR